MNKPTIYQLNVTISLAGQYCKSDVFCPKTLLFLVMDNMPDHRKDYELRFWDLYAVHGNMTKQERKNRESKYRKILSEKYAKEAHNGSRTSARMY